MTQGGVARDEAMTRWRKIFTPEWPAVSIGAGEPY